MKSGIIGVGSMGRALGLGWARGRHQVLFGSRDVIKAKASAVASPTSAQAGDFDDAAAFGDVVLYTVRDEELGFVGVDSGELERAQLVEAVGDFIRFQTLAMGLGPFATISVNILPIGESK